MKQKKLLIDTCSYLRLAQSIQPLLGRAFGKENYCLYAIKELKQEIKKNSRLQNKFPWAEREEFQTNLEKIIKPSKAQKNDIANTLSYFLAISPEGPSLIDLKMISTAYELKVPIITDDQDLLELAEEFEIKVIKTLELLNLMLSEDFIEFQLIINICEYWRYEKDFPKDYSSDFRRLFNSNPP